MPTSEPTSPSVTAVQIAWAAACYVLGCFTAGYYLTRWRTGRDIRTLGSGNVGARNAGRALGAGGFVATTLLDAAKGFTAIAVARLLGTGPWPMLAALVLVVAGHLWPAQLGFRGGKGVSVALGAMLAWDPVLVACVAAVALPTWAVLRSFTVGGLLGFATAPVAAHLAGRSEPAVVAAALAAVLVLAAHRGNLREAFAPRAGAAAGAGQETPPHGGPDVAN